MHHFVPGASRHLSQSSVPFLFLPNGSRYPIQQFVEFFPANSYFQGHPYTNSSPFNFFPQLPPFPGQISPFPGRQPALPPFPGQISPFPGRQPALPPFPGQISPFPGRQPALPPQPQQHPVFEFPELRVNLSTFEPELAPKPEDTLTVSEIEKEPVEINEETDATMGCTTNIRSVIGLTNSVEPEAFSDVDNWLVVEKRGFHVVYLREKAESNDSLNYERIERDSVFKVDGMKTTSADFVTPSRKDIKINETFENEDPEHLSLFPLVKSRVPEKALEDATPFLTPVKSRVPENALEDSTPFLIPVKSGVPENALEDSTPFLTPVKSRVPEKGLEDSTPFLTPVKSRVPEKALDDSTPFLTPVKSRVPEREVPTKSAEKELLDHSTCDLVDSKILREVPKTIGPTEKKVQEYLNPSLSYMDSRIRVNLAPVSCDEVFAASEFMDTAITADIGFSAGVLSQPLLPIQENSLNGDEDQVVEIIRQNLYFLARTVRNGDELLLIMRQFGMLTSAEQKEIKQLPYELQRTIAGLLKAVKGEPQFRKLVQLVRFCGDPDIAAKLEKGL